MGMRSYRPEGFTEEPYQDPEYMHTGLIKDIPALEEIYINVSDDAGEVLGDCKLEEKERLLLPNDSLSSELAYLSRITPCRH